MARITSPLLPPPRTAKAKDEPAAAEAKSEVARGEPRAVARPRPAAGAEPAAGAKAGAGAAKAVAKPVLRLAVKPVAGKRASGGKGAADARAKATVTLTVRAAPDFVREAALLARGVRPVAGVDEVGRGPLAGPVVAAAVILDPMRIPQGLADSKLLPPQRRDELYEEILATADVAVASVSAVRIDEINILRASLEAMRRALAGLAAPPGYVLVDGPHLPSWAGEGEAIVRGDGLVASIAAASIVAKVTRDRMMARLGLHFPAYGFERHAGYATAQHRRALDEHGPCPFHRMTFASCADAEVNEE